MAGTDHESWETQVLREETEKLEIALIPELMFVAHEMNKSSISLLSDTELDEIKTVPSLLTDVQKAGKLVQSLKRKVIVKSSNYEKFFAILEKKPQIFKNIIQLMSVQEKKLSGKCHIEELEKEITCAICHEHYTEPKVLPCCHYYCKQCIHLLTLRKGTDKPFSCPECRQDTTLPQGGVDHLPTAFFINRIKEFHYKLERAHGKVEAKCEGCSGGKAEAFCRQCAEFICAECVKQHQKLKVFAGHKTVSLDELKEGGAKEIIKEEPSLQMCKIHKESMKIYCFTCSCLICRDCTVIDHVEHKYDFIVTSAPKTKEVLIEHLIPLKKVEKSLSHAVKETNTNISEVEAQGDSVASEIRGSFAEYRKVIQNREQELLKVAAMKVTEKLEHLSGQKKSLSNKFAAVQSVIEYTEHCVEHSTDDEIMCRHEDIQSRIDRKMTEEHFKEGCSTATPEEVDIGVEVSCAEDLHQFFQTKTKIVKLSIESIVNGERMKTAEVNKSSELSLITMLSNGGNTKQEYAVEGRLNVLADKSSIDCNVDLIKGNEYRIEFTPTVRGRHELVIAVDGKEIAGSPFPVFVTIHPTQLGKPVRLITEVKAPAYLAINSMGHIIVTEPYNNKDIVVLDREGKILKSMKDLVNIRPYGVAVDDEDNIYIADDGGHKILKLNKALRLLSAITTAEDAQLYGMAVVGEEIMVCDNNNNCIVVYTKELEYVRQIGSHGKGPGEFDSIRDISADKHGNLYVTDKGNCCIHVLSNDGEFLRSFGCEGDMNKLSGICVSDQFVYVANCGKDTILVYTTEGELVTSFGQYGSGEGDFYYPCGVCVDRDGFVYICDCNNYRVKVV